MDELPPERLAQVFTHPSWAAERSESYERLEFLGDSVLELAIARALFEEYPDFSEGQLARLRAHIVSRQSCAVVGRELGLGRRLSRHAGETSEEELAKLARNPNVLGALLEAALAALFLEHGFPAIEPAIVEAFRGRIEYATTSYVDHKTELQEELARRGRQVTYGVLEVEGPPHERTFTVAAVVEGKQLGVGRGRSKKDAEQSAAEEALTALSAER
ncbi:MAG TPA: ribonuclease III [Gaiellaceae bacterium]